VDAATDVNSDYLSLAVRFDLRPYVSFVYLVAEAAHLLSRPLNWHCRLFTSLYGIFPETETYHLLAAFGSR